MQTQPPTTPFGRRPLSLAMVASGSIAKACPAGAAVHKWEVFRALCEGRAALGISERALAVLDALLTFHPETVLTAAGDLVVFPSNRQLALRAHGMAPSTLRRHLAALVEAGILIRRDSPNGKRYQRPAGEEGERLAFGFDLAPLVARAAEFEARARAVREERRRLARLRERVTIARRDVAKMLAAGRAEGVAGDWDAILAAYAAAISRMPREADAPALERVVAALDGLREVALSLLETHVNPEDTSANESQDERHKQNSKPNRSLKFEPAFRESTDPDRANPAPPRPPARPFALPMVLDACPDIMDYNRGGVSCWRDLAGAADVARGALGVSPSAWEEAQSVLGRETAAVVVAAILQKGASVGNAGAYLRSLTAKGREGGFSPGPMLMALLRARAGRRTA